MIIPPPSPRTCKCAQFSSPSLTQTKIGAALHIQFPDGAMVDCDLNVPTIPTSTPYDGRIDEVKRYLETYKPVGWMEEMGKLEGMTAAGASLHMIGQESWQVKMRQISRDTVLPRQVGGGHCTVFRDK